jgi:hypothetical protein
MEIKPNSVAQFDLMAGEVVNIYGHGNANLKPVGKHEYTVSLAGRTNLGPFQEAVHFSVYMLQEGGSYDYVAFAKDWNMPSGYQEKRAASYPSIADQLDAIWKGGQDEKDMKALVFGVKAKYPKD